MMQKRPPKQPNKFEHEHRRGDDNPPTFANLHVEHPVKRNFVQPLTLGLEISPQGIHDEEIRDGFYIYDFYRYKAPGQDSKRVSLDVGGVAQRISKRALKIVDLPPRHTLSFDLKLDFDKIPNPEVGEESEYRIAILPFREYPGDIIPTATQIKTVTIRRDTREADLLFRIDIADRPESLYQYRSNSAGSSDTVRVPNIKWFPPDPSRQDPLQWDTCRIVIGNSAFSGDGKVVIKNSRVQMNSPSNMNQLKSNIPVTDLFVASRKGSQQPLSNLSFDGTYENTDEKADFLILTDIWRIQALGDDEVVFSAEIEFDYEIFQNGSFRSKDHFQFNLELPVAKDLGYHWLALDYGTAAIVSSFGNDVDMRFLIPLVDQLRSLPSRASLPGYIEESEFLLPSTVLLREKQIPGTKEFIMEVPYRDTISTYPERLVPYLKRIIGLNVVPLNKPISFEDPSTGKIQIGYPTVKDTIKSIYLKLLDDYVIAYLRGQHVREQLNQIVISIPNTFTPLHTQMLENLIENDFGSVFKQVKFISESDAVACYYLSRWINFNQNRIIKSTELDKGEYILIYDIGAGTLDLTYLFVEKAGPADPRKIRILGRLGTSSAGNNLDTIIAKIVQDKVDMMIQNSTDGSIKWKQEHGGKCYKFFDSIPPHFDNVPSNQQENEKQTYRDNLIRLRQQIKTEIKPVIAEQIKHGDTTLPSVSEGIDYFVDGITQVDLTVNDIMEDRRIRKFISDNSTKLLENFFGNLAYEKGTVPLHTAIFSGRTILFPRLKEAVVEALNEWCDSSRGGFEMPDLSAEELKLSVCQGAMAYVTGWLRDKSIVFEDCGISAKYGIIYNDAGEYKFEPFVTPQTPPNRLDITESRIIREYSITQKVRFPNLGNVDFVQSYSLHPEKDWAGEKVLTTSIWNFNPPSREPTIEVEINSYNQLTIRVGQLRNSPEITTPDLRNNPGYQEGMWPYFI